MTDARASATDVRPFLRRRGVQLVMAVFALTVAIGTPLVLAPSGSTVFAVSAATGVVELRPLCPDKVVWDLPPGEVQGRSCLPENPDDLTSAEAFQRACSVSAEQVTVTLLAGATAKVELDAADRWLLTFGTAPVPGCSVQNAVPLLVSAGDADLPFDPQGFFYRPHTAAAPAPAPSAADTAASEPASVEAHGSANPAAVEAQGSANLALALLGRVIIGQPMQFGAGWTAGSSPILNSARFVARSRALGTGQPLTVMDEDVEAGTIIDTHPTTRFAAAAAGPPGAADAIAQASGFVQLFDEELLVQVYQPESIGLLPYASESRIIRVPRWRPLWASPPVQLTVSVIVVAFTLLSLVFGYYQAKESMPALLRPPQTSIPTAVSEAQDAPP